MKKATKSNKYFHKFVRYKINIKFRFYLYTPAMKKGNWILKIVSFHSSNIKHEIIRKYSW